MTITDSHVRLVNELLGELVAGKEGAMKGYQLAVGSYAAIERDLEPTREYLVAVMNAPGLVEAVRIAREWTHAHMANRRRHGVN